MASTLSKCHKELISQLGCHRPIFKFSADVHKVIYANSAIESLNITYRRLNRQGSVFSSDTALLKILCLTTYEILLVTNHLDK
jgi:transposase-like protein